jgi:hypothetical protein
VDRSCRPFPCSKRITNASTRLRIITLVVFDVIETAAGVDILLYVVQFTLGDILSKANIEGWLRFEIAVDVVHFHELLHEIQYDALVIDDLESLFWSMNTSVTAKSTARIRTNVSCIATTRT